jgi:hypothetical protein
MRFVDRHPGKVMQLLTVSAILFVGGVAGWIAWLVG